jgi:UDP-N-acetylmuramoyl-L-alanyl-D-glutamate--2,6-diaminopimelate ligase
LTTPDSKTFARWLGRMVDRGATHAAVELSSHALDQDRTAGTRLDAAVVTNVTQDHFDYHGDYPAYLASKARIVEHLKPRGAAFLFADDPGCRRLCERLSRRDDILTYGFQPHADVRGEIIEDSIAGTRFRIFLPGEAQPITADTPLIGRHNVANALGAAAAAQRLGATPGDIVAGLETLTSVPGRLERIDCGQPFEVFVDYAHTDDALRRAVECVRRLTHGRIICVFGAGGDRDRTKRPLLAQAASSADMVIVTSDNPRTEDPQKIIADILAGFSPAIRPRVEPDRAAAIALALEDAQPGDCVLIAGKGHECEQIIGAERIPFDDRETARRALRLRAAHAPPPALRHSA